MTHAKATHTKRSNSPKPSVGWASRIGLVVLLAGAALVLAARPALTAERIFSIEPPLLDEPMSSSHVRLSPSHEPASASNEPASQFAQETAVFAGGCFLPCKPCSST